LEVLADASKESGISVSLEHFHEERASGSQGSDRETQRGVREVEPSRDIDRAVSAQLWGHVAQHDVRGFAEAFEEFAADARICEVAAQELDALDWSHPSDVHGDHASGAPDTLPHNLRPPPRCRAKINDHIAVSKESVAEVDLG